MTKARITVTHTFEFEMNPDNYPGCNSDLERLGVDIEGYSQVDALMEAIATGSGLVHTNVTGELIREPV
ncbi:hypothetical protein PQQ87_08285 [Paraburkholderia nemoris]|uniref:hypothetical protein n=1 Tax=Paraburkholderia nemoris TaxID=2793076 RepID=UPI0038B6B22E